MHKIFILLFITVALYATKINEVASIVGVRDNQLIGYSLVIGLKKTGDGTTSKFTLQSVSNMLKAMNIDMSPNDIKSKNVAAVVVTAKLPAFARQGDKIDITVSSIGDAKSLEGGTLLMTPLKGVDGKIYALGQGPLSIGGKNERGATSESHPTAGLVYGGGMVEREVGYDLYNKKVARLSLKHTNFSNAIAIQNTINNIYNSQVAVALDPRTIELKKPTNKSMIEFLAAIQNISVEYQQSKKIIINERTGTVVAGVDIVVKPVIITHGAMTVKILEQDSPDNPNDGVAVDQDLYLGLNQAEVYLKTGTTTVANVTRALQKLGATSKDIISILEAMKSSGAIAADLEVI
ncbi:MAG: flagellar basal body P-ring protein FlgI [Helicobacteraceae bacterium]|nr:flagellar basal body P-ring protein FlgI [Helicobacteraceae bacterium]